MDYFAKFASAEMAFPGNLAPASRGGGRLQQWLSQSGYATAVDVMFRNANAAALSAFRKKNPLQDFGIGHGRRVSSRRRAELWPTRIL
jgi:hypothetical protein